VITEDPFSAEYHYAYNVKILRAEKLRGNSLAGRR